MQRKILCMQVLFVHQLLRECSRQFSENKQALDEIRRESVRQAALFQQQLDEQRADMNEQGTRLQRNIDEQGAKVDEKIDEKIALLRQEFMERFESIERAWVQFIQNLQENLLETGLDLAYVKQILRRSVLSVSSLSFLLPQMSISS